MPYIAAAIDYLDGYPLGMTHLGLGSSNPLPLTTNKLSAAYITFGTAQQRATLFAPLDINADRQLFTVYVDHVILYAQPGTVNDAEQYIPNVIDNYMVGINPTFNGALYKPVNIVAVNVGVELYMGMQFFGFRLAHQWVIKY